VKGILAEMKSLRQELKDKGSGDNITINVEKVNLATNGGNVTDNSKNYSIGNVESGATTAQGDNAQATGSRSVSVGGNNSGMIMTGDGNTANNNHGDQISVGNISNSQGLAIGRGASAVVTIQHGMASSKDPDKQALKKLIADLEIALSHVPETHAESAEAVTQTTQALVTLAVAENPNKMMLGITGDGLKKAAANLAEITPNVLKIATGIVLAIGKIVGIG
jgi:hypothetical protein